MLDENHFSLFFFPSVRRKFERFTGPVLVGLPSSFESSSSQQLPVRSQRLVVKKYETPEPSGGETTGA
jgi:hypothetical protein